MTTTDISSINYLEGIRQIPGFEHRVDELRKKHNYPRNISTSCLCLYYDIYISKMFYTDVLILRNDVIKYLKVTFPIEINTDYLFNQKLYDAIKNNWHYTENNKNIDTICRNKFCALDYNYVTNTYNKNKIHSHDLRRYYVNIESFVSHLSKPECTEPKIKKINKSYGYNGIILQNEYYPCRCSKLNKYNLMTIEIQSIDKALLTAYNICLSGLSIIQRHNLEKEQANNRLLLLFNQQKKNIDIKFKDYEQKLRDSISMHYFPERIENGIRKPAEWLADFNIDIVKSIDSELRRHNYDDYYNNIVERIRTECKPLMDNMKEKYYIDKQKEYEDTQARIMAKAMILSDNTPDTISIGSNPKHYI